MRVLKLLALVILVNSSFVRAERTVLTKEWGEAEVQKIKQALNATDEASLVKGAQAKFEKELATIKESMKGTRKKMDLLQEDLEKTGNDQPGIRARLMNSIKLTSEELESWQDNLTKLQTAWESGRYVAQIKAQFAEAGDEKKARTALAASVPQSGEFYGISLAFDKLEIAGLNAAQRLLSIENMFNQATLGAYVQQKMERLIGSDEFCTATKECPNPKRNRKPNLSKLFESVGRDQERQIKESGHQ